MLQGLVEFAPSGFFIVAINRPRFGGANRFTQSVHCLEMLFISVFVGLSGLLKSSLAAACTLICQTIFVRVAVSGPPRATSRIVSSSRYVRCRSHTSI